MAVRRLRWQDMDHSEEPLISQIVTRNRTQEVGTIPEFLAKKKAEEAEKTQKQYVESLGQLVAFLETFGLTTVGDLSAHAVQLFRIHLGVRGLAENTIVNRLRAARGLQRGSRAGAAAACYPRSGRSSGRVASLICIRVGDPT
jgi:hypothetical protein